MQEDFDLKGYVKCAFDLETAIYENKRLLESYTEKRKKTEPTQPVFTPPTKPTPPINERSSASLGGGCMIWIGLICIPLIALLSFMNGEPSPFCTILTIPAICLMYNETSNKVKANKVADALFQREMEQYRSALARYDSAYAQAKERYDKSVKTYPQIKQAFALETADRKDELNELEQSLEAALSQLYGNDVIYPKYRNYVAMATIYEYLESGRCDTLEGANGAYNLFEQESRANIVIASLSEIINSLESIKSGQYALYESITRANAEVKSLLYQINDAQRMTAYYAAAAAFAARVNRYSRLR